MPRERLFTRHRRKVLRKRISLAETVFGASFILLVALASLWIGAQKDSYNPGDRDISFEVLKEQSVDEILYTPPLRRWVEPGSEAMEAGLPDLGPFPRGILEGGWELDGRVESYDAATLYEKINGAAEQYIAFGFKRLHYLTLARGGQFLNLEVYDQGEFRNVLGIFSAQRSAGRRVRHLGEIYYYETPVGLIGGYRNLYFKIAGSGSQPPILEKAAALLEIVPDLPARPAPPPRAFSILTRDLGVPFDGLEYKRSGVFQYGFLSDFWFGALDGEGETRFFIHEAPDEETALSLFERLGQEQRNEYTVEEEAGTGLLLEHRFLKTWFALSRSGIYLYGVDGAPTRRSARESLVRLGEALSLERLR